MARDWRSSLRPASFRTVPFYVAVSEREGGRRIAEYEYPFFDRPIVDDFGRMPRTFQLTGYVLGDDYFGVRDRLIAAVEDEAEPGDLVHPYHGTFKVICKTYKAVEKADKGGYCEFTFEFKEALSIEQSLAVPQTTALDGASDQYLKEVGDSSMLSGLDDPGFILEQALSDFNGCLDEIATYADRYSARNQTLSALSARLRETRRTAISILKSPGRFIQSFRQDIADLGNALDPKISVSVVSKFYNTSNKANPIKGSSFVNRIQRQNQRLIFKGMEKVAVALSAVYFVKSEGSRESFIYTKDRLVERIALAYDEVDSNNEYMKLMAVESLSLEIYEARVGSLRPERRENQIRKIGSVISKEYARTGDITNDSSPLRDIYG